MKEVRRDVVKLGLDFRPIPVDVGDGIEWSFHPDPSPEQWSKLMTALKKFTKFKDEDFGNKDFTKAIADFTRAMSDVLVEESQRQAWIDKNYGFTSQQAIAQALMELWTGFPTKQSSPSGKASKKTG